jgi:hypothetical protein
MQIEYSASFMFLRYYSNENEPVILEFCKECCGKPCNDWSERTVGCKKKTGIENFPNVNLVLPICQLIVYLPILIK